MEAAPVELATPTSAPLDPISTAMDPDSNEASTPPSDVQQRHAAAQSTDDVASGVESGATPPPHLDPLREERERARRQILESLGTASAAVTPAAAHSSTAATIAAETSRTSTGPAVAGSAPNPLAAATISALLGGMAAGRGAPEATAPQTNVASSPSAPSANTTTGPVPDQQHGRPQPPRPQAIRVPMQPEMISGTSMVVQGALVARTIPNRSASPGNPPSSELDQGNRQQANTGRSPSTSGTAPASSPLGSSSDAESHPGVQGSTLYGDDLRGAVTLEEQAVMLSRILGIAAAATAASLLNTAESHDVDPSLLQTSLRRPLERMNQASSNRGGNERWLADWQRSRPSNGLSVPSSNNDSFGAQARGSTADGLGSGLRDRLAALSRRVQGASGNYPRPRTASNSSHVPDATHTPAPGSTSNNDSAEGRTSTQQEIIAHLLSAAEREAASQRLSRVRTAEQRSPAATASGAVRARSSSLSSSRVQANPTQQTTPRSSLARLARSTLDTFMHPSRLLSSRNAPSGHARSAEPSRDAWSSNPANTRSSGFSLGPNDVAGTLSQVRNGILPDGVPGSFGSFLNHLVCDLMAAVQLMRPSSEVPLQPVVAQTTNYFEHATHGEATSGAEVLDGDASGSAENNTANVNSEAPTSNADAYTQERARATVGEDREAQARRDRDFQNGNLSFFRLFRFDPVAPSQLVPCIVVGVRSLNVTERFDEQMAGARAHGPGREFQGSRQQTSRPSNLGTAGPTARLRQQRARSDGPQSSPTSDGEQNEAAGDDLPASRFMLFVSGGRYPPNHPLLTSNPATAGRDLMILMDLLSTMQAMQHKPSTATQQEIDASDLLKIKGSEVSAMVKEGKITENVLDRCLVCLEEWKDDDECRVLACRHAFHATCVDRWMSSSSNTCPMCRRQGVTKDGRQAGDETADSRRAAQV